MSQWKIDCLHAVKLSGLCYSFSTVTADAEKWLLLALLSIAQLKDN